MCKHISTVNSQAILSSYYGCPDTVSYEWKTSFILMQSQNQTFSWTPDSHLRGLTSRNTLKIYFCMVDDISIPGGNFCVWKTGTKCPKGMFNEFGSILL